MAAIAIIVGHARRDTFCEALGIAYQRGAKAGGHTAELFVLSRMNFDPILHEGFSAVQTLEPDLQAVQDAIGRAAHLVLIFPLWMGTMPAILKGFLERRLRPGTRRERHGLQTAADGQIGTGDHHHGHASDGLSLVVRCPRAEGAEAQSSRRRGHLAGAVDHLRHGRHRYGRHAPPLAGQG